MLIGLSALALVSCAESAERAAERNRKAVSELADEFLHSYLKCNPDSVYMICTDTMNVRLRKIFHPVSRRDSMIIANVRNFMSRTSHVIKEVELRGDSATITYALITSQKDTLPSAEMYALRTDEGWKIDAIPEHRKRDMKMPEFRIRKKDPAANRGRFRSEFKSQTDVR